MLIVLNRHNLSVVIPAIGRKTLSAAVKSVLRENLKPIIVSDGYNLTPEDHPCLTWEGVRYIQLGRNFGKMDGIIYYGQVAITTGVYLADTEFCMAIGDDDELIEGAGKIMTKRICAKPDVDIWVPGLQYNNGRTACMSPDGLFLSNVSHTCYRTKIFAFEPMHHIIGQNHGWNDFFHAERCVKAGWKIDWFFAICVLIRPSLIGEFGHGTIS